MTDCAPFPHKVLTLSRLGNTGLKDCKIKHNTVNRHK